MRINTSNIQLNITQEEFKDMLNDDYLYLTLCALNNIQVSINKGERTEKKVELDYSEILNIIEEQQEDVGIKLLDTYYYFLQKGWCDNYK